MSSSRSQEDVRDKSTRNDGDQSGDPNDSSEKKKEETHTRHNRNKHAHSVVINMEGNKDQTSGKQYNEVTNTLPSFWVQFNCEYLLYCNKSCSIRPG